MTEATGACGHTKHSQQGDCDVTPCIHSNENVMSDVGPWSQTHRLWFQLFYYNSIKNFVSSKKNSAPSWGTVSLHQLVCVKSFTGQHTAKIWRLPTSLLESDVCPHGEGWEIPRGYWGGCTALTPRGAWRPRLLKWQISKSPLDQALCQMLQADIIFIMAGQPPSESGQGHQKHHKTWTIFGTASSSV